MPDSGDVARGPTRRAAIASAWQQACCKGRPAPILLPLSSSPGYACSGTRRRRRCSSIAKFVARCLMPEAPPSHGARSGSVTLSHFLDRVLGSLVQRAWREERIGVKLADLL
jgi:hypothetical protein